LIRNRNYNPESYINPPTKRKFISIMKKSIKHLWNLLFWILNLWSQNHWSWKNPPCLYSSHWFASFTFDTNSLQTMIAHLKTTIYTKFHQPKCMIRKRR